jgi:hypothetical protein
MSEIDESRVRPMAVRLKKLYYQFKGGSTKKMQARSDNMEMWDRTARVVMELDANPEDYIAAAFKYSTHSTGPFPSSLHGPTTQQKYLQHASIPAQTPSPGEEQKPEKPMLPSQRELRALVDAVRASMWNNNGHEDLTEDNVDIICCSFYGFNPLACMILAGTRIERVRDMYLEAAMSYVDSRPDIRRAVIEADMNPGFPIQ